MQPDVEPDRRVEGAILVDAQVCQLVVEHFAVFLGEIAILDAPVGDGAANAVDELPDRGSRVRGSLLAVEVLGDDHLGGQERPELRHFDVLLVENYLSTVVRDGRRPSFPLDLVEWIDARGAEYAFKGFTHMLLVWRRFSLRIAYACLCRDRLCCLLCSSFLLLYLHRYRFIGKPFFAIKPSQIAAPKDKLYPFRGVSGSIRLSIFGRTLRDGIVPVQPGHEGWGQESHGLIVSPRMKAIQRLRS